jgi:hypothetical protein
MSSRRGARSRGTLKSRDRSSAGGFGPHGREHLQHIYEKLATTTRSELARALGTRGAQDADERFARGAAFARWRA